MRRMIHSRRQPATSKVEFDQLSQAEQVAYRQAQQQRRARRVTPRGLKILELVKEGFHVQQVTPTHFLVNGRLDLYTTHNTWRDRVTLQLGHAKSLAVLAREWRKQ